MTLNQILNFVVLTFFIVSCSSEPTLNENLKKSYSMATQKEFEAIEKNDQFIPPTRSTIKPLARASSITKEVVPDKRKEISKAPAVLLDSDKTTHLSNKSSERLSEINQNLAFFCMKHRKDNIFPNEESCLAFTRTVLNICEKKHKLINTVMVNCIKDRLKKKS